MDTWYIRTGASGKPQGPFTPEQIDKLKAEGRIRPDMEASRDGVGWASVVSYGLAPAPTPGAGTRPVSREVTATGRTRPTSSQVVATGGLLPTVPAIPGIGLRPVSKPLDVPLSPRPLSGQAKAVAGTRPVSRPGTRKLGVPVADGMLHCPACGAQVTADAARCPRCPCPLQDIGARNAFLAERREFEATRAALPTSAAGGASASMAGRTRSRVLVTQDGMWVTYRWAIQQAAMGAVALVVILYAILSGGKNQPEPVIDPGVLPPTRRPEYQPPKKLSYNEAIIQAESQTVAMDVEGALKSYALAAEADPRVARPHMMRGYLYGRMNDLPKARDAYERATQVEPAYWEAWRALGDASARIGDDKRALSSYRLALQNGAPAEHRLAIAKLVEELDLKLNPPVTPVDLQQPLPEADRLAIEALVRDWSFEAAARALEPHRGVATLADAVKLVEQHLKDHEEAARTMYLGLLGRQVDDLEARQQFGPAINALRSALPYVDDPAKIQAAHLRIAGWRREARELLMKRLEAMRNYLGTDMKANVLERFAELASTDAYAGSAEVLRALAREFEAMATYDRSLCDAWIARLPKEAPFAGEESAPAGAPCPTCAGKGFKPCAECRQGLIDGRCYLCQGQGRVTCKRCGGGTQALCRRCGGTGITDELRKEREKCATCSGIGKVGAGGGSPGEICEECKGVGTFAADTRKQVPCKTCRQSGRVPCDMCEQKGQRSCPNCKGAGQGMLPHSTCGGLDRVFCAECRGLGIAYVRPALPLRTTLPIEVRGNPELDFSRPGTMSSLLLLRSNRSANALRLGGSSLTEECVDRGLAWLAQHQSRTGQWEGAKVGSYCPCHGPGKLDSIDPALTGLALLAFLGAGQTPINGDHRGAVTLGLQHLVTIQDVDGCIGGKRGPYLYNHAIGTLALVEAYGMTQNSQIKGAATRALAFLLGARTPGAGWRYVEREAETDVVSTEWAVSALWCARKVGLSQPRMDDAISDALVWCATMTNEKFGITGYKSAVAADWQGPTSERYDLPALGVNTSVTHTRNHTPTVIGILFRERLKPVKGDPRTAAAMDQIVAMPPSWDTGSGGTGNKVDYMYWYYATQALIVVGGDAWSGWNTALRATLPSHQHNNGHLKGSWDPVDAWGYAGGRVYATAINVLTLESYYRYARSARE